ncbi:MAG: hypothetical protein GC164_08120 [Phycisphaera sp.]|nr:hypothetical protein [Phycisphaera sp.]
MAHKHEHAVPLWTLFLLLLAFTAAEVGFYEIWVHSNQHAMETGGVPFMPKVAMVLVLLFVLTLPKALIVLVYFMHLKFEKLLIVGLAVLPFVMVGIAILPNLSDTLALKSRAYNHPTVAIGDYAHAPTAGDGSGEHGHSDAHEATPAQTQESTDSY